MLRKDLSLKTYSHRLVFWLMFIVVGVVYSASHIFANWQVESTSPVYHFVQYDVVYFLAQLGEIRDGFTHLSSTYVEEYKEQGVNLYQGLLPLYLLGFTWKYSGLDLFNFFVAAGFLLPSITFLFFYRLFILLHQSRFVSLLGAFTALIAPRLAHLPTWYRYVQGDIWPLQVKDDFLYQRLVHPQVDILFYLSALALFYQCVFFGYTRLRLILLATIYSALLLSYYYFWTTVLAMSGLAVVVLWLLGEKSTFRSALTTFFVLSTCTAVYLAIVFLSKGPDTHLQGALSDLPIGFARSHLPIVSLQGLCMLFLAATALYCRKFRVIPSSLWVFSAVLLIAGVVGLNQHVVTGLALQPHHYAKVVNPINLLIAITVIAPGVVRHYFTAVVHRPVNVTLKVSVATVFCCLLVVSAIDSKYEYSKSEQASLEKQAQEQAAYSWINENLPDDATFLFDPHHQHLPVFTSGNALVTRHTIADPLPSETETRERFMALCLFAGYTADEFNEGPGLSVVMLPESERIGIGWDSLLLLGRQSKIMQGYINEARRTQNLEKYNEMARQSAVDMLDQYGVDYVFYGPYEQRFFRKDPSTYSALRAVYNDDNVTIFAVETENEDEGVASNAIGAVQANRIEPETFLQESSMQSQRNSDM